MPETPSWVSGGGNGLDHGRHWKCDAAAGPRFSWPRGGPSSADIWTAFDDQKHPTVSGADSQLAKTANLEMAIDKRVGARSDGPSRDCRS